MIYYKIYKYKENDPDAHQKHMLIGDFCEIYLNVIFNQENRLCDEEMTLSMSFLQ